MKTPISYYGGKQTMLKHILPLIPQHWVYIANLSDENHYLLAGGRLTVQKASRLFETTELRKIVSRLRRRGQPIEDVMHYDTTRTGRRVQFKEYFIRQATGA